MEQKKFRHPTEGMNAISKVLWTLTKGVSYWCESQTAHLHKFDVGDILIAKTREHYGFGLRPVMVVNDHSIREDEFGKHGIYQVSVHNDNVDLWYQNEEGRLVSDSDSPIFKRWSEKNEISKGLERMISNHGYCNSVVEDYFKKVNVEIEEALMLYHSREV